MVSLLLPPSQKVSTSTMAIGDRIRLYRRRIGLTQKELASRVGVSPGTIGMYETHQREPDLETIRRLASALGVSVSALVDESDPDATTSGREELALHHTDRLHDPDAPISDRLAKRIRELQEELGRLADELAKEREKRK